MSYTIELAAFCAGIKFADLPVDLVDTAKKCILDYLGCALGASRMEEESQRLARYVRSLREPEEATLLGLGLRSSSRSAALAQGSLVEMLELQDTYGIAGFHPASCVMPAAMALAEARHSSGKELLTSIIAGYEAGMRIGAALGLSHLARGFMSTGTAGTFGAGVAAGVLLGLGPSTMSNCLGIAGFVLPFSMAEDFFGGHSIKPLHGGQAARMGIESALLAAEGYTGSDHVLEGSDRWKGFLAMSGGPIDLDRLTQGLGERYEMSNIAFKIFPCCGLTQTAVEATISLASRGRLDPAHVESITVRTFSAAANNVGKNFPTPSSSFGACQFSMPYLVAAAIKHGELGLEQLTPESIHDPETLRLSARVSVVEDPELTRLAQSGARPSIVEIVTTDGTRLTARSDFRKGDPRNPMTDEQFVAKFETLAGEVLDEAAIQKCKGMVSGLEALDDVAELMGLCAGPGKKYPAARSAGDVKSFGRGS